MNLRTTRSPVRSKSPRQVSGALSRILGRMPREIGEGFTADQLGALDEALDCNNPMPHRLNLQVTLFGRFYLAVLAGPEPRSPTRGAEARERRPPFSPGNVVLLTTAAVLGMAFGYTLRSLMLEG